MSKFDRLDIKILDALQEDGRISNLELAKRVGLSASPCLRRVKVLEEAGVIRKYVAVLEPRLVGLNLEFTVDVKLKSQTRALMDSFEKRVERLPQIVQCNLVAGEWDYSLKVLTASLEDYQSFQLDRLMGDKSEIAAMRSTLVMRTIKSTMRLSLPK